MRKHGDGVVYPLVISPALAQVTTGTPVACILPGEGVELEGGERIHAPVIVSNADPQSCCACWAAPPIHLGERRSNRCPSRGAA